MLSLRSNVPVFRLHRYGGAMYRSCSAAPQERAWQYWMWPHGYLARRDGEGGAEPFPWVVASRVQAALAGRLCPRSQGERRWGSCLAEAQVQVPVSVRLSGSAICCESLFGDRRTTWGEQEQIAVLLLGWVFFIPFTTAPQVHGFILAFCVSCILKKGIFMPSCTMDVVCPEGRKDVSHPRLSKHTKCRKSALGISFLFIHH